MAVTVRDVRDDERGSLLLIWRSAVESTHHFLTPREIDRYEPYVVTHLRTATDLRVAIQPGSEPAVVGFIAHDAGAIRMLFVHAGAHRRGVGSALLASVRDDLRRSCSSGELTVDVNEANMGGRRFYAAHGFTVASRSPTDDQGHPHAILHLTTGRA